MQMKVFDEQEFVELVKPLMLRCRAGDWEHAKRVVGWIKELAGSRDNLYLLIVAGYIHDLGWKDVTDGKLLSKEKMLELELVANNNSEKNIREVLGDFGFDEDELKIVFKLVKAADKHQSNDEIEEIVVDADNLSKLNIDHLREKFERDSWMKWCEFWKEKFPERIKTEKGKSLYPDLLERLKRDIVEELSA